MAFGIGTWCRDLQPKGLINGIPGNHFELADQTASTTVQTLVTKSKYFRAVVYVKNILAGASSASFYLQAAPVNTLGPSVQHIDVKSLSGSAGSFSFMLQGFAADAGQGGVGFVRVEYLPASGSFTFDCIIDAL